MKSENIKNLNGDWGLGIGDWAQSPKYNFKTKHIISKN